MSLRDIRVHDGSVWYKGRRVSLPARGKPRRCPGWYWINDYRIPYLHPPKPKIPGWTDHCHGGYIDDAVYDAKFPRLTLTPCGTCDISVLPLWTRMLSPSWWIRDLPRRVRFTGWYQDIENWMIRRDLI